jgi:glycosyltransferase involved in cell wall biosynthesis
MSSPIRILTIGHSYCIALNRRLAHEMAQVGGEGWDVTAIAPSFFCGDLRPVPMERTGQEACRSEAVPAYLTSYIHFMFYGWRLREILNRGWDLVHCWEEPYVVSGGQIATWSPRGTPLVFWTAQNICKDYPFPFPWIEEYCFDRCTAWAAGGQSVVDTMLARGYGRKPHVLLPLGVEVERFHPDAVARQRVLRGLGWDGNPTPPVIGFLGRFVPEKGPAMLMRSLDNIRSPWRAMFVGNGPMEEEIRRWSQQYGNRVRVLNNVTHDEVAPHLNAMDLLCAPSQTTRTWREQFGRMIIEAFACGVPVIASDSGEIPNVVRDAGMVIGEKDSRAWEQAIGELLNDSNRRRDLAARGLDRVHTLYTWRVIARKYLDFFKQVL